MLNYAPSPQASRLERSPLPATQQLLWHTHLAPNPSTQTKITLDAAGHESAAAARVPTLAPRPAARRRVVAVSHGGVRGCWRWRRGARQRGGGGRLAATVPVGRASCCAAASVLLRVCCCECAAAAATAAAAAAADASVLQLLLLLLPPPLLLMRVCCRHCCCCCCGGGCCCRRRSGERVR